MKFNPISSRVPMAGVFLFIFIFDFGQIAGAQTAGQPSGVEHIPAALQALPDDSERSLTAAVVKLAPVAKSPRHHHSDFSGVVEDVAQALPVSNPATTSSA